MCRNVGDDNWFWAELQESHEVRDSFERLAETLEPKRVDPKHEQDVVHAVRRCAEEVCRSHVTLSPIGSTFKGTDLIKTGGEQSDVDYALTVQGKTTTEADHEELARRLEQHPMFHEVRMGRIALSFRTCSEGSHADVAWDIVPTTGSHFNWELFNFPSIWHRIESGPRWRAWHSERLQLEAVSSVRLDKLTTCVKCCKRSVSRPAQRAAPSDRAQVESFLWHFFREQPGAKGARSTARVLKRMLSAIPGFILELLLLFLDSQDQRILDEDPTGLKLFQRAMQAFKLYQLRDETNPLILLLKDAQSGKDRHTELKEAFSAASQAVQAFYNKECCCVPRSVWELIMCIVQIALFTILSLVFCILFWFADKERQFSQQDCQTDSCLCNDCNQQAWRRWRLEGQGSACHFGYVAMERCWIRFVVRVWRLGMVLLVMGWCCSRGSRRSRDALHVLVLLASMCHFLSHSSDLWPNPRVWMSCLFLDLADTLRLVASLLVVVRCLKDPLGPSQWDLSESFSPTVAAVAAAMVFWLLAWLARWLCTSITFEDLMFQQHHFFNAVCIVANTLLATLCFLALSADRRKKEGKLQVRKHTELMKPIALCNLLLQLLWCSLVGAHLYMGIVQPGSFSQWSFLANILKTSAGLLHFVLLLRFADAFAAAGHRSPPVPFLVPIRQAS
ncbi:unnamed protein product [Symbiodinium sp. CCMP2592]|nr:unnamed protein product [Symbiodinium sp. CCMP2592]